MQSGTTSQLTEYERIENDEGPSTDLAPLNIIRTETVLSRLPIHNLTKRGKVEIHIVRKNTSGEVDLRWDVSYSERHGDARLLAYKLDTLVIDRRVYEHGRPIPKALYLGSLRSIAQELGLKRDTNKVKQALRQNAFTGISAYLHYEAADGAKKRLEGDFTRYEVWFYGEELPDGRKSDAVYVVFHDRYREVLNSAETRPLDYDYIKKLKPSSQRFYELVSYKIFAAIKYRHPHAKMLYSEYCTFAPQQRYYDYDQVKKQMYKVHLPHIQSAYIQKSVKVEETTDSDGKPDWIMYYVPGAKAQAEYEAFTGKRTSIGPRASEKQRLGKNVNASSNKAISVSASTQLVRYFYKRFHNVEHVNPSEKALAQAKTLITEYGLEKAQFIVDFAYDAARETGFKPELFGGILAYAPRAIGLYEELTERKRQQDEIVKCKHCDKSGYIVFENAQGHTLASKCPHDLKKIRSYEQTKGYRRIG